MKKGRSSLLAILAVAVVVALAIGARLAVWTGAEHQAATGGSGAIGGAFTLVHHDGRTVSDQDFRGRWLLIYFGYTFCPDVCPTSLTLLTSALDRLDEVQRAKITPIFVTVDPARDTPEVMAGYVSAFAADMIGLTGSDEQVAAAMRAFKVYAAKVKSDDPTAYTVDHSSILYLIGPDGRFVQHFAHGVGVEDIAAGLKKHLK
jgi:protein SCO1/2